MQDILNQIGHYLFSSLKTTFVHVFLLMGPGLILAFFMNLASSLVKNGAWRLLGGRLYLGLFGWLAVTVHEIGHAVMCLVFFHKIEEMKLFSMDPEGGTLGYVRHSYNPNNIYQVIGNFFIALGPIILGSAVIYFSAGILLEKNVFASVRPVEIGLADFTSIGAFMELAYGAWESLKGLFGDFFTGDNVKSWRFWLFIYILFCVGSGISLSREDINGGFKGFAALFLTFFLITLVAGMFGGIPENWVNSAAACYSAFYSIMGFSLFLNVVLAIPFSIVNILKE